MSTHWISDYQKPNEFVELTLDDLKHAGWMAHEAEDYANAMDMHRAFDRRLARKHAYLDLSEDLSEQGLVVVEEAQIAKLSKPDLFNDWDDPDSYGCDPEEIMEYRGSGLEDVAKISCARSLPFIWAAHECLSLFEEGDPNETVIRTFGSEDEAKRCWPESLARLKSAAPSPGETGNG